MNHIQPWWVIAEDFRLLCQTKEDVKNAINLIISKGGVPQVEEVKECE